MEAYIECENQMHTRYYLNKKAYKVYNGYYTININLDILNSANLLDHVWNFWMIGLIVILTFAITINA